LECRLELAVPLLGVAGVDLAILESGLPDEVGLDKLGKGDALRRLGAVPVSADTEPSLLLR
jgi:hypothetical protein